MSLGVNFTSNSLAFFDDSLGIELTSAVGLTHAVRIRTIQFLMHREYLFNLHSLVDEFSQTSLMFSGTFLQGKGYKVEEYSQINIWYTQKFVALLSEYILALPSLCSNETSPLGQYT
jgi:hypothetical protein